MSKRVLFLYPWSLTPLGVLLLFFGLFLFFGSETLSFVFGIEPRFLTILSLAFIIYGSAALLLAYLRGGIRARPSFRAGEIETDSEGPYSVAQWLHETRKLSRRMDAVEESLTTRSRSSDLSEEDRQEIKEELIATVSREAKSDILTMMESEYSDNVLSSSISKRNDARLEQSQDRLFQEIDTLGRRNNLNLVIGVLTTAVAVGLLWYTVIDRPSETEVLAVMLHYIPRVTLSIFIEVFSFFFLRLYKAGLAEIKYYQNELTTIALKYAALDGALLTKDNETVKSVLNHFASVDRNFIDSRTGEARLLEDKPEFSAILRIAEKLVDAKK